MLQLTFNPGLTLTGFRTTRPWSVAFLWAVVSVLAVSVLAFLKRKVRSVAFDIVMEFT